MTTKLPILEEKENYTPFFKVTTFSSRGRSSRMYSHKTKRTHVFLSKLARSVFLYFEFWENVIDIREYYPLLDVKESVDDIDNLRFDLFSSDKKDYTLTTTFLVTFKYEDELVYKAFSVKQISSFKRKRTLEKLEIERRYWNSKNIEWKIITDKEINQVVVDNIEMLREVYKKGVNTSWITETDINYIIESLENNELKLAEVFKDFERGSGYAMLIFKYLVMNHSLKVNLDTLIHMNTRIKDIVSDTNGN